jgi:hypothetical protein
VEFAMKRRLIAPLLLLSGCLAVTDAPAPEVETARVQGSGELAQTLEVALASPAPLSVEYWSDDGPRMRVTSAEATEHSIVLARLRAGRSYHYRIVGSSVTGELTTDPLPSDLAAIGMAAEGRSSIPLVLLHLYHPDGFKGYAIVDAEGEVVWYHRTVDFPFGATRRSNGDFVFMDKAAGLVEVTPTGEVVHTLPQDLAHEMHHDVISIPSNTLLYIAFDPRRIGSATVKGEGIWEWSPELGTAVQRWSAWDFFSPDTDRGPRFGEEWMHANSLAIGPRGNVLLSVHYFDQIVSIAADWKSIEWRLGGVNATIQVDPEVRFSGQHTAREIAPGRVVLFDDGVERGGYSRAVEYELAGAAARQVWEWRATPDNYSAAVSSARRLANGNTLIGFGMSAGIQGSTGPTEVYEADADGRPIWHLVVSGITVMYRAEPIESIAGEEVIPP